MKLENNAKLSFRAIEAFVAVVEEQSISLGAKRLGASVSAVSLQLSNLEKALDTKLIERTAQRFTITEAGHIFRTRALRILDEIDGAKTDLVTRKGSPHFTLRMAVVDDLDNHVVPIWLEQLSNAFPNCRFVMKSGPSHENFSILSSRGADLIIAVDAMEPVDWIEEHPLMRDPYILVTAQHIPDEPNLDELMNYPFVRYAGEQHMGRQIEAQLRRIKYVPVRLHEFSSNQALFSMVNSLGGWAISTVSAIHGTLSHRDQKTHNLKFSKLPMPAFSRTVSLYTRKDILNTVPQLAADTMRSCMSDIFHKSPSRISLPLKPLIFDGNEFQDI